MRDIKFRAKSVLGGSWICGHYAFVDGYHVIYENGKPIIIQLQTVGQYTGLKDKNGNEIFEGDILRVQHPANTAMSGVFSVTVNAETMNYVVGAYNLGAGAYKFGEVIGDIYQNQELVHQHFDQNI